MKAKTEMRNFVEHYGIFETIEALRDVCEERIEDPQFLVKQGMYEQLVEKLDEAYNL